MADDGDQGAARRSSPKAGEGTTEALQGRARKPEGGSRQNSSKLASEAYLIATGEAILERFRSSPFYVRAKPEVDVARYGKRPRHGEPDAVVLDRIGNAADDRYLPAELLPSDDAGRGARPRAAGGIKRHGANANDDNSPPEDRPTAGDDEDDAFAAIHHLARKRRRADSADLVVELS